MIKKYDFTLILFYFLNAYFFFDLNGHWSNNIDSEIIWPYNALLILSGYKVEFIEFGSTLYIFLALFQKLINAINLSQINNLSDFLDINTFSSNLQELIFFSRIFNIFLGILFLLVFKRIIIKITKNEVMSLVITLILFFSPGFIISMSHVRADFVSLLFILLFLFFLIKYVEDEANEKNLFLILSFIFFNLSILTKIQAFLYFPIISILVFYFSKKRKLISNRFFEYRLFHILTIFLIIISLIYPILFLRYTKLSIIFLYYQIFIFNLLFYLYIKFFIILDNKNNSYKLILKYNLFLIGIYFLSFIILNNLPYYYDTLIIKLTYLDPSSILQFAEDDILHKNKDFGIKNFDLTKILIIILNNLYKIFEFYFLSFNYQSLLLYIILILYIFKLKVLSKNNLLATPIFLFIFLYINLVNSMRSNQVYELYFIFSDYLLIILLSINLSLYPKLRSLFSIVLLSFLIVIFSLNLFNFNINNYGYKFFVKKNNINAYCGANYVVNFANKFSKNFQRICDESR